MKRRPKIFRVSLEDETRLQTIASRSFSGIGLACILIGGTLALMMVGALLLAFTPLRSLIPGYVKESQREATQEAIMKIDSLQIAYEQNEAYLENLRSVYNTERETSDSLNYSTSTMALTADSLLPRSAEETRFAAMMQEREKFNLGVIASMASEGMLMYPVCDDGVVTKDSRNDYNVKISVPDKSALMSIADGVIIAAYYDPLIRGNVVLTQHDNGFVSRVSGAGSLMVGQGDEVQGGEILSSPPKPKAGHPSIVEISLWHNGTPVKPYEYVIGHRFKISSPDGVHSSGIKKRKSVASADSSALVNKNVKNLK